MSDNTSKRNVKIPLLPGFSLMHWVTLTGKVRDLSGVAVKRANITKNEVYQHRTENDLWTVLDGKVYNITQYARYHPGGVKQLMLAAGADCTALFNESHRWVNGHSMLEKCFVGTMAEEEEVQMEEDVALHAVEYRKFKLMEKVQVSEMTVKFRFALNKAFGIVRPGQHVMFRIEKNGEYIERAYTPISNMDAPYAEFLIKLYANGVMSQYLRQVLEVGGEIEMAGPRGTFGYLGNGSFQMTSCFVLKGIREIGMIAGGSGVTPMIQLIKYVLAADADSVKIRLVCVNRRVENIIAQDELDQAARQFQNRFSVHHILTQESNDKELYSYCASSAIQYELVQQHVPKPSFTAFMLICGPLNFEESMKKLLLDNKHSNANIRVF